MFFYRRVQPPPFGPGGQTPPAHTAANWGRIIVAILLLAAAVGVAFWARSIGWDSAAERFLDIAKVGAGALFGALLGEKTASK